MFTGEWLANFAIVMLVLTTAKTLLKKKKEKSYFIKESNAEVFFRQSYNLISSGAKGE